MEFLGESICGEFRYLCKSDQAVRKQVNRYRDELGVHLYKQERTPYLDEEGERFLDGKRAKNPVIIIEKSKDGQIEDLQNENELLKLKIMELQDQVISTQNQIIDRDAKLLEMTEQLKLTDSKAEDIKEKSEKNLREKETEIHELKEQLKNIKNKGLFDRILKKW